jgi:peroxiredoxin
MKKYLFVSLFLCGAFSPLCAQQTEISGNAPLYAGKVLKCKTTDNYFSLEEITLAECTVAANGDFHFVFDLVSPRVAYLYLGVFKARLCVEPGMHYTVQLPPHTEKTQEEAEFAFFEPVPIYLQILSVMNKNGETVPVQNELNNLLMQFDAAYNPVYDQLATDVMKQKTVYPDSLVKALQQQFLPSENSYFNSYAVYRCGLLYYVGRTTSVKHLSNAYFSGKPILPCNEAYMELFNLTYRDYFMYFGRTQEGRAIYPAVNERKSLGELKQLLARDGVLAGDSLLELVVLKNIFDEFYASRFSRQSLLSLLDSLVTYTPVEVYRQMGVQIRGKITRLLRGYAPPAFSLYNQDGELVSPESYQGKYVYLMFCTTQNCTCLSQYELLKEIYRTHGKWLKIAVIAVDERFEDMREFRLKSGYLWDFLHYAHQPDVLEAYDIRTFPTYFLIDPQGKLLLSPAPDAGEIERRLYLELSAKGLWNEYMEKGWIDRNLLQKRLEEGKPPYFSY